MRFRDPLFPDSTLAPAANLGARYAMPEWLTARWLARFGPARTTALLRAQAERPPVALRVRTGTADDLRRELLAADPAARLGPVDASLLLPGGEGGALVAVERGVAAVQDPTAQRVAPLLAPRSGQRLLDLCAAPGGKALHLADLLDGRGEVVACDVVPKKLAVLADLRRRVPAGVAWTSTLVPADGPLPFEPASFDGVLVDAPCSNTGVLRRRVEARWRLTPADLTSLATLQRSLLERALPLLRPGGRLVYSTCSLEPEENEDLALGVLPPRTPRSRACPASMWPPTATPTAGSRPCSRRPRPDAPPRPRRRVNRDCRGDGPPPRATRAPRRAPA